MIEQQLLDQQQLPPANQNHTLQAKLMQNDEDLLTKNAIFHRQRLKKLWASDDDRNTEFFLQSIMKRARKNRISHIKDDQGNPVVLPQDIANIFISYFENLFTSQLRNAGQIRHHTHQVTLTDDYTMSTPDEQEIAGLLKQMKKNASPGPDGLNVAFYRAAWPWINKDIMELVTQFYYTGNLHTTIKTTSIVLIPKKAHPTTPKISDLLAFAMSLTKS